MTPLPALDGPSLAPASGGEARQLVILLHGYGSNGNDLISLAPYWHQAVPDALFLAPNGPEQVPGFPGGYQWWDLSTRDRASRAAGVARAAPVLDAYIDQQLERYGLTEEQLVLVGFSQGTMMALHVGPRRARRIAGIVGYSGMLAEVESLSRDPHTKPPVLLLHGSADEVISISSYQEAKTELERLGFDVGSHVSAGLGHSVDMAGLELGRDFVRRVLVDRTEAPPTG
ncbi:MAG TPA: dienelactone hydrolase family protein [Allosphingosinicella sp.]